MDWEIFFADKLVEMDDPNQPVIDMAIALHNTDHHIAILSGRSESTKQVTTEWLQSHRVPFNVLKMRPTEHPFKFMPDEKLKSEWFDEFFKDKEVVCVFDDRDKVVKMWREIGLTCMQVAPGDF